MSSSTTVRPPRPRRPVERTATLTAPLGTDGADGRLLLTVGKEVFLCWLAELPTQIAGRAFSLAKVGHAGEEDGDYHILVGTNPADTSCTCKGWTYKSRCKHVAALSALVAAGRV
jgi:hypothetical protein